MVGTKVNEIYALIPDFAGFTVKADSEGRPGPRSFGRTPADAANTLAAASQPHNGVVLYRAFVYNHHLDWHDPKADRARAAYDIFHPLDGKFAPNVIIQTKEGPIDFQAREPVSPLFGGLAQPARPWSCRSRRSTPASSATSSTLPPCGRQVLDFDMRVGSAAHARKEILSGKSFHQPAGRLRRRRQCMASTTTGCIIPWPWPTSTASAASRGIPTSPRPDRR